MTGTSKTLAAGTLALAIAGCGTAAGTPPSPSATAPARVVAETSRGPFAWVHPRAAPAGWRSVRIPSGARLAYPPSWRAVPSDRGTASAQLEDARGTVVGYLNLTPRQGAETLANWATFRPRHNTGEGQREVRVQASARGLPFRGATGSCVRDSYLTRAARRYVEIACLVQGRRAASVIVAAAPPADWAREAPILQRAIQALAP